MNDSLRILLIRGFASLLLCLGFATAHAQDEDNSDHMGDVPVLVTADDLEPITIDAIHIDVPEIQIELTPLEQIKYNTAQFLGKIQRELDRTANSLSYAWYKTQVNLEKETTCLAQNIYYEARGEALPGQLAVALVTINRVKTEDYPPTICGVVFQRTKNNKGQWVPQFTWTRYQRKSYHPKDEEQWAQARTIAEYVLNGGDLDNITDITNGSMFYHAAYLHPKDWKKHYERTVQIGNHIFFRSKKEVEYRSDPVVMARE